ncbi:hypothetical protein IAT38_000957 [Cryptococcus sp. DSM 104549]
MPIIPRQDVIVPLNGSSSTSSSASATSSGDSQTASPVYTGSGGGGSTSLYLFTFLITIVVLALISAALVLRAYVLRRRFQRRVEEALRQGQPLPTDAAAALGLLPRGRGGRAKKEKKVGVMPSLWEGVMVRDKEEGWMRDGEKEELLAGHESWDGLTPLTLLTSTTQPIPPPPPPPITLPPMTPGSYFRAMFSTRGYVAQPHPPRPPPAQPQRPGLNRNATAGGGIPRTTPSWNIPQPGEEFTVGVMIAMPCEPGRGEELWVGVGDEEEKDLPEVSLGVLSARMGRY